MRRVVLAVSTVVTLLSLFVAPATLVAQGIQTGTIRGHVTDAQDLPVPGVTVTVTSPNLQGPRSTVTDEKGIYTLSALPAGSYTLSFELPGFAKIERSTEVLLGLPNEQNAAMRAAGVAEAVQVTAERPAPIASPVVGANYRNEEIESLATPRTIQGIAQLAPATTMNSPNNGQVVINGAFGFDNVFMINGVDINDNLFAQPQNLFIEDAIEETQVLTSGISAEFGRFSGGVVNAITKSGSNRFSGSGRVNFSNPSWTTATPFEESRGQATVDAAHPDTTFRTYEGTFGGPVLRDRLWFFSAGRYQSTANPATLPVTGLVVTQDDKNKRGEIKLTGTPVSNHTIQGGYLNNSRTLSNSSGLPNSFLIDPHVVVDRDFPNNYYYTNYRGVLKSTLLVEAQYSQRHFQFGQTGPSGANILDSPFLNLDQSQNYNAPYFDVNDPEDRNNRQLTGSATQSWNMAGRHETKGGYEWFRSQRTGGNSQSPTSYVFVSDYVTDASGAPVLDSGGKPIPTFVPGESLVQYYPAIKGAELNIDNHSLYVQDHWTINGRLSADIGARFEHVNVASTGGITSIKNDRIVPRLALGYDVRGDGKQVVHVTYGQYSGRYNEAQVAKNSPVGNAPEIDSLYQGPAGQGYDFAPGVNPANYPITQSNVTLLSDAKQNVLVDQGMHSPLVHEWSVSYGASLFKNRGYGEVSYIGRVTHSLIEDFQTIPGGVTDVSVNGVSAGDFTNVVYGNSDIAKRNYHGLVFQSRYRIRNNWSVNGHYTLMLKNDGNYEGEEASKPGQPSIIGNYPEAFSADRNYPEGHLQGFQRSRARVWSVYDWKVGRFGTVSLSGLWRVESARVFSLAARNQNPTATQLAIIDAAGYPDAAVTQPVFFTGQRGDQFFKGFGLFDASINYNIPVMGSVRPWVKVDLYNLFDNRKLIAWNTTVSQNFANVDSLGLGTAYTPGAAFGTATGNTVTNLNLNNINTYPLAFQGAPAGGRTVRIALGVRF